MRDERRRQERDLPSAPVGLMAMSCRATRLNPLPLLLLTVLSACPNRVRPLPAEYDPAVHFGAYRTYAWTGDGWRPGAADVEVLDMRVRRTVDVQLAEKGYGRQSGTARADFLVRYRLKLEEKTVDTFRDFLAYRDAGGTDSPQGAFTAGFEEATLILEIFDGRTRQLAWRASAEAVVQPRENKKQTERINNAITQMLMSFPP